jgi:TRAP-type mannitol/chloroaromatic compound transport system permease small subunit
VKSLILVSFGLLLLQAIAQAVKFLAIAKGYTPIAQAVRDDTESIPFE